MWKCLKKSYLNSIFSENMSRMKVCITELNHNAVFRVSNQLYPSALLLVVYCKHLVRSAVVCITLFMLKKVKTTV